MEGRSLHPDHGPRGVRIFDPDEVEDVAERIEESGRALDYDFSESDDGGYASPFTGSDAKHESKAAAQLEESERRLRDALRKLSELEERLRTMRAEQGRWKATVGDACAALIGCLDVVDDDVIEAVDELAKALG